MSRRMVELGDRVKDRITHTQGIVTCRREFVTGTVQFQVTPEGMKEDKFTWFHPDRLKVIEKDAYAKGVN